MPRHSDDATRQAWRKRLQRFGKSGYSVAQFCAQEGVSVASFYNWRKKVGSNPRQADRADRQRRASGRRAAFHPIAVVPAVPGVPTYVGIHLPCGARIEVPADDLEALRAVVAELARTDGILRRDGVSC